MSIRKVKRRLRVTLRLQVPLQSDLRPTFRWETTSLYPSLSLLKPEIFYGLWRVWLFSGPNFSDPLERHDPRDELHDLLVLFRLFQVVGGLQPYPYFRRAAKQAGHLQAHDRRKGLAPRQNVVKHLAGHAKSLGPGRPGQADRRQDIFLDNLARMDGRQSVLSRHSFFPNGSLQNRPPKRFRLTSRK